MTLLEYGLRFAQKFNTNYNYMFINLSMVWYTIQNTDISLVEVSFFFFKNRQTTKEHSLMSKKDSHKKTDQNADQNNQMNEMDENFSGRFCKWSEFFCHLFQEKEGQFFNIMYANKNSLR